MRVGLDPGRKPWAVVPDEDHNRDGAPETAGSGASEALKDLFVRNRAWAEEVRKTDPDFFLKLTHQQAPQYFWIGCSDSRVPATQILGLMPGEMFVHRNVANLVSLDDPNCLSALEFAVEVLKVGHVIVCGHYGCAGVRAALRDQRSGHIGRWLEPVRELCARHRAQLNDLPTEAQQLDLLCELNVRQHAANVRASACVQDSCNRGQPITVHNWIYAVSDGLVRDLAVQAEETFWVGIGRDRSG